MSGVERSAALAGSGSALQRLRQDQSAANRPAATVPPVTEARSNPFLSGSTTASAGTSPSRWNNADGYLADRDRSWTQYRDQLDRDRWARQAYDHSRPSYGTWDTVLLTALLTHTADSAYYNWAYAHHDDPGYRQWHDDQVRLANDNADLKAKLAELDDHVRTMERDGAKKQDATALPPGVDPSAAVAPAAVLAAAESRGPTIGTATNPLGNMAVTPMGSAPARTASHGHGIGFYLAWVVGIAFLAAVAFVAVMIRRGKAR